MPLLNWEESLSVGVKEIDAQHKKMFGIINELYDAMQESRGEESANKAIQEMTDYADYHFSTEEKYFKKFNYENSEEHKKTHEDYKEKILGFSEKLKENKELLSFEILDYLEDWWLEHVNGEDKGYTKCFNEHGLN